jgi:hypothetical protein
MKEFEGTPGPWFAQSCGNGNRKAHELVLKLGEWEQVFGYFYENRVMRISPEMVEANARLAAAAPELLEALQIMLSDFESIVSDHKYQPAYIIARDAVKKALHLTTAELDDPDTDEIIPIELWGYDTAAIENLLYDMEGFDINEMDKNVAFIQTKYIIKRNPKFYTGNPDQEAAAV